MGNHYFKVRLADFFPYSGMVEEISGSFTVFLSQCFQARSIIQLVQQPDKEANVSTSVDEVSTGALIIWFPDL